MHEEAGETAKLQTMKKQKNPEIDENRHPVETRKGYYKNSKKTES